jgi:hypothetical protein
MAFTSLYFKKTLTTALTASVPHTIVLKKAPSRMTVQFNFVYGSSGTNVNAHIETSLDGGTTWIEIAHILFATASERKVYNLVSVTPITTQYDATTALANDVVKDGILGSQFRANITSTGTYAGTTTLEITASFS